MNADSGCTDARLKGLLTAWRSENALFILLLVLLFLVTMLRRKVASMCLYTRVFAGAGGMRKLSRDQVLRKYINKS